MIICVLLVRKFCVGDFGKDPITFDHQFRQKSRNLQTVQSLFIVTVVDHVPWFKFAFHN